LELLIFCLPPRRSWPLEEIPDARDYVSPTSRFNTITLPSLPRPSGARPSLSSGRGSPPQKSCGNDSAWVLRDQMVGFHAIGMTR
jgi:hypothetical protein